MTGHLWPRWRTATVAAIASAVAAIASACVAYSNFRDSRDIRAMEVSIKFFGPEVTTLRNAYYTMINMDGTKYGNLKEDLSSGRMNQTAYDAAAYILYLDYLAGLINEGKISRQYVTDILTCDIWKSSDQAFKVERANGLKQSSQLKQTSKFRNSLSDQAAGCQ